MPTPSRARQRHRLPRGPGHIVVAWIWLEQFLAAAGHGGAFYDGKRRAARYFFRYELPQVGPAAGPARTTRPHGGGDEGGVVLSREAVIVAGARTPIGKAYRGSFNATLRRDARRPRGRARRSARPGSIPAEVDDVIIGGSLQRGHDRHEHRPPGRDPRRASGHRARHDHQPLLQHRACMRSPWRPSSIIAGGDIDRRRRARVDHARPERAREHVHGRRPVAARAQARDLHVDDRDRRDRRRALRRRAARTQDAFALESQRRTAAAQEAGRFDDEIVPITTDKVVVDKATGETSLETVDAERRRVQPAGHDARGLAGLPPVLEGGTITAGNASQLSDGAAACVVMDARGGRAPRPRAARRLPRLRGRRLRARRDGHRTGVRGAEAARSRRPHDRRHRPLGAQRGLRRRRLCTAATASASRTSASTSTAARSPSAIRTG